MKKKSKPNIKKKALKLFYMSAIILSFCPLNSSAQSFSPDVIASAGNYSASASNSMAWTLGETVTETNASANNFFTQGFHQPWSTVTAVPLNGQGEVNIQVYPNPAIDFVTIEFKNFLSGNYSITMSDMLGQNVVNSVFPVRLENPVRFDLPIHNLSAGVYILAISSPENNVNKKFRISKPE